MSENAQQLDFRGFAAAVGFGSMAALMGSILLGAMVWDWYRCLEVYEWPRVEAQIISAEVGELRRGPKKSPEYRAKITYQYEWQGKAHRSKRVDIMDEKDTASLTLAQVRVTTALEAKAGRMKLLASVDPAQPEAAVLFREPNFGTLVFMLGLSLLMVFGGAAAVWSVLGRGSAGLFVTAYALSVASVPILWEAPAEIALGRGPAIYIALLLPLSALLAIVALIRK